MKGTAHESSARFEANIQHPTLKSKEQGAREERMVGRRSPVLPLGHWKFRVGYWIFLAVTGVAYEA